MLEGLGEHKLAVVGIDGLEGVGELTGVILAAVVGGFLLDVERCDTALDQEVGTLLRHHFQTLCIIAGINACLAARSLDGKGILRVYVDKFHTVGVGDTFHHIAAELFGAAEWDVGRTPEVIDQDVRFPFCFIGIGCEGNGYCHNHKHGFADCFEEIHSVIK